MNFESNDPTGSSLPSSEHGAHNPALPLLKCICGHCHACLDKKGTGTQDDKASCCPPGLLPSPHAESILPAAGTATAAWPSDVAPSAAATNASRSAPDRRTPNRPSLRDILEVGYSAPEMASTVYKAVAAAVSSFETIAGSVPVKSLPISLGYKHAEQLLSSGLSRLSVTRRLLALSSVVVRGKDRGLLPLDLACPFDPALRAHRQQRVARVGALPLRAADLQRLFSSSLYQHGHPDPLDPRAGRFWAPLVGLLTGARMSELASAQVSDIECYGETWVLALGSDGRGTRNTWESRRTIPLHPDLVRCGFVAYAAQRKLAGLTSLLPIGVGHTASAQPLYVLSRWYGRHAKAIGLRAEHQGLSSLRMTFVVAMARLEMPRRACNYLAGLEPRYIGPVMDETGQPQVAAFAASNYNWIRQLQFDGLELSRLYVDDPMAGVEEAYPTRDAA